MNDDINKLLPLIPLRDIVVYPGMVAPLFVGREKSVKALEEAMNADKAILLATQLEAGSDDPTFEDINKIGKYVHFCTTGTCKYTSVLGDVHDVEACDERRSSSANSSAETMLGSSSRIHRRF